MLGERREAHGVDLGDHLSALELGHDVRGDDAQALLVVHVVDRELATAVEAQLVGLPLERDVARSEAVRAVVVAEPLQCNLGDLDLAGVVELAEQYGASLLKRQFEIGGLGFRHDDLVEAAGDLTSSVANVVSHLMLLT